MKFFNFLKSFQKPSGDDLFSSYPDGIFVVESDGAILNVNSKITTLYGVTRFDMVGRYFSKFVEGGSALLNKLVQEKAAIAAKALVKGREVYLELTASQNAVSGNVYVCAREITGKHEASTALSAEFKHCKNILTTKNVYFAGVANDILSPLTSIVGFSKALLDGVGGNLLAKQEKYLQIINKNSNELYYDLSKILTYIRAESDLYNYEPKKFDIINYLNDALKPYKEAFRDKMLTLAYDFSSLASRNGYHDPNVISYAIISLVEIALRGTDVGGCSIVAYNPAVEFLQKCGYSVKNESTARQFIVFEIKSSGIFYSQEELDNIFNPYYGAKDAQKREIGSKFVYPTIERHLKALGGKIIVTSRAMAGTTTFVVIPSEQGFEINEEETAEVQTAETEVLEDEATENVAAAKAINEAQESAESGTGQRAEQNQ